MLWFCHYRAELGDSPNSILCLPALRGYTCTSQLKAWSGAHHVPPIHRPWPPPCTTNMKANISLQLPHRAATAKLPFWGPSNTSSLVIHPFSGTLGFFSSSLFKHHVIMNVGHFPYELEAPVFVVSEHVWRLTLSDTDYSPALLSLFRCSVLWLCIAWDSSPWLWYQGREKILYLPNNDN